MSSAKKNLTITLKRKHSDNTAEPATETITIAKNQPTKPITSHFQSNTKQHNTTNTKRKQLHIVKRNNNTVTVQPTIDSTIEPSTEIEDGEINTNNNTTNNEPPQINVEYNIQYNIQRTNRHKRNKRAPTSITTRKPLEYTDLYNNDLSNVKLRGFGIT